MRTASNSWIKSQSRRLIRKGTKCHHVIEKAGTHTNRTNEIVQKGEGCRRLVEFDGKQPVDSKERERSDDDEIKPAHLSEEIPESYGWTRGSDMKSAHVCWLHTF